MRLAPQCLVLLLITITHAAAQIYQPGEEGTYLIIARDPATGQ